MKKLISIALFGLSLVAALEAAPAAAQEFMDYTVAPGDTCGSIAERIYGSPRRYMRIHTHNPALGPLPHRLMPGTVLRLPLPRESSADATVTDARGSVRRQLASDPGWSGAAIGDELGTGSRVSTGERSSAELTFRASTVAAIRAETLVIVHGGSVERVREEGSHAVLRDGSILSRLSALSGGAPLVVETPAAEVEVREGETSVHVNQVGTSVSTHRGRPSRVRARGRTVEVPAGTGAHVPVGAPPEPPRPLPSAPAWTTGEVRSFLGLYPTPHRSGGGTVTGSWLPVTEADVYHVEIARRDDGRDVVFQADVPSTVTRFEAHGLPPGRYYVRVATYDAERLEGRPESAEVFEVVGVRLLGPGEPTPAPSEGVLALEELDALADTAFSMTESPEMPEALVGSRAMVPDGVVCAAGISEPSHELVLTEPGATFLTCIGGGATIAGIDLTVVRLRARVLDGVGVPVGTLARDGASEVVIAIDAHDLDVRGLAITAEGGEVSEPSIDDAGNLHATLTPFSSSADPMTLAFALRTDPSMVLGSVEVLFEDPPPPPPAPPPAPRHLALHEGLGLFAMPSWVGLRDEQRAGIGATLGLTFASARLGERDPRMRLIAGAQVGLFEDYLRIAAVAPLDVIGQPWRSADRGARDLYFSLGSRVLRTDDTGGLGMALEVGMWAPSAGQDGLDRGRLMFAVDVSFRFAERFALRTRQSGIFDLADGLRAPGSMLWASAYGFDVEVAGPLSLGLEGTVTIGREDGRDWYAGGVGLGVGIDLSPVVISVAGRYGFGDDLWPTATVAANVRASFE